MNLLEHKLIQVSNEETQFNTKLFNMEMIQLNSKDQKELLHITEEHIQEETMEATFLLKLLNHQINTQSIKTSLLT